MLKILAHYNTVDNEENRSIFLAACNKLTYIIDCIAQTEQVQIISASNTLNKTKSPRKIKKISDNIQLTLLRGFARGGWLRNKFSTLLFTLQLYAYLFFNIKKEDTLLVYHSLSYMKYLKWLKRVKKFKLILEVEEIYGDVLSSAKTVRKELSFFKTADAYIFPTVLLHEKVNVANKPYTIIHGTYQVEKQIGQKFNDGRIHCVYAGTFDPRKGGALAAVSAAKFLNERYHIHILGFGSENDKKSLIDTIAEVNQISKCRVTYDGLLFGEDYIRFIQSCDIGLSTQNPDAAFNDTSFPSKVLSYLANGLRVVSAKIKVLETSALNDLLYYYQQNDSKSIAMTIQSIDMKAQYNSLECIGQLHNETTERIKKVVGGN